MTTYDCSLNPGVLCDRKVSCEKCGWNPSVKQKRLERRKLAGTVFNKRSYVAGEEKQLIYKKGRVIR